MVNNTSREQRLKNFTENMIDVRKHLGWTQEDLAERLKDAGLKFYPQTVQKIETGERRIQLAEAIEIAAALDRDLEMMLETTTTNEIARLQFNVEDAALDITRATKEFLKRQLLYAQVLDVHEAEGEVMPDWARGTLDITPEDRVSLARKWITEEAASEGEGTAQSREKSPTVYAVIETLGLGSGDE